jgi:hypothetical protein
MWSIWFLGEEGVVGEEVGERGGEATARPRGEWSRITSKARNAMSIVRAV